MTATVKLKLNPLTVPTSVGVTLVATHHDGLGSYTVPVTELDHDALEELAYGFLIEFYKNAGKTCPFYRPARDKAVA